jgi:hypothetical protein
MFKSSEEVVAWFGNRGIEVLPVTLKKWHWQDGKLYYVIQGSDGFGIPDTELGTVDVTYTHAEDGRALRSFEPYDCIPIARSPFAS